MQVIAMFRMQLANVSFMSSVASLILKKFCSGYEFVVSLVMLSYFMKATNVAVKGNAFSKITVSAF